MRFLRMILPCLFLIPLPAAAVVITVPGDAPTIQAGIDLANPGDTVNVLPGTYFEHVVMDALDSGIIVKSSSPGAAIIDGSGTGRVFTCSNLAAGSEIRDFTIRNGRAGGISWPTGGGGGILSTDGSPTIVGNVITGNYAGVTGGGIDLVNGSPSILDNTISTNTAVLDGGGIRFYGTTGTIRGNHIEGNVILGNGRGGGAGGGLASGGSATTSILENEVLNNNAAVGPGGIYLGDHSSCDITNNVVRGNSAGSTGGGIRLLLSTGRIEQNTIELNTSGLTGGGLDLIDSHPTVKNNTIRQNTAVLDGGGIRIYACDGSIEDNVIESNTITGNGHGGGAGGGIATGGGATTAMLANQVLNNTAAVGPGGIYLGDYSNCEIRNNRIEGNSSPLLAGGIRFHESGGLIAGNVIVFNDCPAGGGGAILIDDESSATIQSNTIYGNSAASGAGIQADGLVEVRLNIVVKNEPGGGIDCSGGTTLGCNDVWSNAPYDYGGCPAGTGDFAQDPAFCGVPVDFHISTSSPCVDGFGCGLVGALGATCGPTGVDVTSWGSLKTRYR